MLRHAYQKLTSEPGPGCQTPTRRQLVVLGTTMIVACVYLLLSFFNLDNTRLIRPPLRPHEELLERLSGQTLHFIGDSVTRYQFNQLVYYLETGLIPHRDKPETLINGTHDPCNEKTWASWPKYYHGTTDYVKKSNKKSLTCDCFRRDDKGAIFEQMIENREYVNGDVRIVFHQYFKDVGTCSIRGRLTPAIPDYGEGSDKIPKPDYCFTLSSFTQSLIEQQKQTKQPFTLILNCGLHEPFSNSTFNTILGEFETRRVEASKDQQLPLLIWKTTTPTKRPMGFKDDHKILSLPRPDPLLKVLDTRKLFNETFGDRNIDELYWDALHFSGEVYMAFNEAVLEIIEDYQGIKKEKFSSKEVTETIGVDFE
ncbi:hypothetical protein DFJ77DRAFT_145805 [Powellomyces hirtus]|nr:hypothetical protein DFJ77DRAFT_145805 [Powellomyces hirtus]